MKTQNRNTGEAVDKVYITTSEAARILDRSAESVRLYERKGALPAIKTSRGMRLFAREAVEEFKNSREKEKSR